MRRFTLWCLLCSLTVTMNAQTPKTTSAEALSTRLLNLGSQQGSISDFFTQEEQQILKSHSYPANQENEIKGYERKASRLAIGTEKPVFQSPVQLDMSQFFVNNSRMGAECLVWQNPTPSTGWVDFNTIYGGAPTQANGCPFNEIDVFEVYASEAYSVDNFTAGVEYTFSMCNGPGAGSWVPDFTIISPSGTVDAFGAGDGDGCSITWTASESGTYLIVINEEGFCGGGTNTATNNGYPALTCAGGGGGGFPDPYCGPIVFTLDIEPITLVEIADINNVSSAVVNGSPSHEDFTAIIANMEIGTSYDMALEGNTGGNYENSFTVFIDWNQDGILDNAGERYEIGIIENSTGIDGIQALGSIEVPADALEGETRMRVIKRYQDIYATDSCTPGSSFGQAEDYTVNISASGGGGGSVTAYGINNGLFELIGFDINDPSTTTVYGDSPITNPALFENAGAIDPANPTTGYVLDNGGNFYSFDVATGFYTALGSIAGDWVGMEYDQSTGILYAITTTSLYTIDVAVPSATLVGSLGLVAGDLPIALAIDASGMGYTYELVSDVLYSVDLATGATTLIGAIGFDANFGQGMCYDADSDTVYMAAFNGGSFQAEWRSVDTATGATTLVGPIVTDAATTQVAWVSIGETLPPPACPEPTNLVVSNIDETTADLAWEAEPNATNGYEWFVFEAGANPVTDTPVDSGLTPAGTTTATATGLTNGSSYDFYVVADCDADGLSTYAGPITFETLITPPACGGQFYDTGGLSGPYENNANVTTTITPDVTGDMVTATFTSFEVETAWDALYVYDGPDASSPLISSGNPVTNGGFPAGGYYGTANPGPFTSTHPSGALTFVFLSDGSVVQAGWVADVTCATPPPPNDMIVNSIDVDEIGFPYTDPAVAMHAATTEDGNPSGCDIDGANGVWYNFVPEGDGTATASIITPSGASSVTIYTAPDEEAIETDLALVVQTTNQCAPGTTASINTVAGQAYYVFVLNTGGATDIVIDGTNLVLGLEDNIIEGFTFYPNPSSDIVNLKSMENIENVALYNILGQKLIDLNINNTTTEINVSALSTGTYIMKVNVNGRTATYKLIKD